MLILLIKTEKSYTMQNDMEFIVFLSVVGIIAAYAGIWGVIQLHNKTKIAQH